MSACCRKSIGYCVFWNNITPHSSKGIIPLSKLISYEWQNLFLQVEVNSEIDDGQESDKRVYSVGDKVWVKPHRACCTSLWNSRIVAKVNSEHDMEVDGVPRHVCDMRRRCVRGLFKKYPTFLYKAHNTINFASFIQSPSKYSPWWFTHLSQRFCHFSKHFINSSPGML